MHNFSDENQFIDGILPENLYPTIKETAETSRTHVNSYLAAINRKFKECNLANMKSLNLAKDLQKLYDTGKNFNEELNSILSCIEIIESIELCIKKIRMKNKELINANKSLKFKLNNAEKELQLKEEKLLNIKEKNLFYNEMITLSKYDVEKEIIDIEYEIWDQCIYDKLNLNPTSILKHYKRIVDLINTNSLDETMEYTKQHLITNQIGGLENEEIRYQKALCFLLVSKFCFDSTHLADSLKFGMEALHQSKSLNIEKPRFLSKVMACISIILLKNNETTKALFYVTESLKLLESISEADNDKKMNLADQYVKLGYIFANSSLNRNGIELMELGVITYSFILPNEELNWVESLSKLARVCNDSNYIEDTMIICEKLILYFHNKRFNLDGNLLYSRNIFDIAVDVEEKRKISNFTEVEVPIPVCLPQYVQTAISELVIIFSKNHLFTGASLLSNWLKYCQIIENDDKYKGMKFFIPLETIDNIEHVEENRSQTIEVGDNKPIILTKLSSQIKVKQFSSKIASLFRQKTNKSSNSNMDLFETHVNMKKLLKIFKK